MLKIEKWAADKPIWLAMLSHQVVSAMDALYCLCQLASDETLISNQMHPDIFDKWVLLYSNPQGVYREIVCNMMGIKPENFEQVSNAVIDLKQGLSLEQKQYIDNMPVDRKNRLFGRLYKRSMAKWRALYREHIEGLKQDIRGITDYNQDNAQAILSMPEVQFFFRVWVPCWLQYHTLPHLLLNQALAGDFEALAKLLNLDRFVLLHPGINGMFLMSKDTSPAWFEEFILKLQHKPEIPIDMPKIKKICGAFVYYLSHVAAQRQKELESQHPNLSIPKVALKMPDIQKLFDAYAYDSLRQYRDIDLPDRPDSFAKAIKRELPFWKGFVENWT